MKHLRALSVLSLALALCACNTTTPVSMQYDASAITAPKGNPVVAVSTVTSKREKSDPYALGAILGGFGNPLQTITSEVPVTDVVKTLVTDGLKARNLASPNPKYNMTIDILRLDCSQLVRREAHVDLAVTVQNASTQEVVFNKGARSDKTNGSVITMETGILASTDDLRAIMNEALQEAVNNLLDDPQFRAAIQN